MKTEIGRSAGHLATADDVAEAAGVSRWTVSRAFKKGASISPKTRNRVLEIAEKIVYLPDLQAASLSSERSNLVALLVDDFNNPHKLIMLERLTRVLRSNGLDTLLVNTLDGAEANHALLAASQRRVDAAIVIGIQFSDAVLETAVGAQRVKKLIIFARSSKHPNTISIAVNDRLAMTEMTNYVLSKGYKRPLFLAGPNTSSAHLKRKETFAEIWTQATGAASECVTVAAYDSNQAYDAIVQNLKNRTADQLPDVLVCENDSLALGAIDAIRFELGLKVPQDIAVTGFDDVPQAARPNYQLTTYRQPLTRMAECLVRVIKGEQDPAKLAEFEGSIVIRESA